MNLFRQIGAVTMMNFKSLPHRVGTSIVIVIGIAGVVAVLVSVLAMSTGMLETMEHSGRDDRAIVLRNGSASETGSAMSRDAARLVQDAAGVKRDSEGKPIASAEALRLMNLFRKEDGAEVNVAVRGTGPQLAKLRPEVKIIQGRMFQPAVTEMIVGKAANAEFKDLNIGDKVRTRGATWTIVGVFTSGGDSHESGLMADAETLIAADQRGGFQSVTVLLESPAAFQKFKDALTANPALAVDVSREREYYRRQSETIGKVIYVIAYVVGGIMAIGAIFSALNTMYSAVSARLREIATLRAIGFGGFPAFVGTLAESLSLAAIGGLLGATATYLIFDGVTASTLGGNFTQVVFDFKLSGWLIAEGVALALIVGLVGGLFPAIRAARMPIVAGLYA